MAEIAKERSQESLLYREVPAYAPETVGYRFAVAYRDPDISSPTIDAVISNFNSLPTVSVEKSHHPSAGKLRVISPHHGRSTELNSVGGISIESNDPRYSAFSLKGNTLPSDMQYAPLKFDQATGIRIQGVMIGDEKMILSYPEKCRRIADAGIPSERIVAAFKATHVPFAEVGKKETWDKPREWDDVLRAKKMDQMAGNNDQQMFINSQQYYTWGGDSTMNARRSLNLIQSGEIIIFLRAMQVNERIRDISSLTEASLEAFCRPGIEFVRKQNPEEYQFLPLKADIDEKEYLQQWLPQQMGFHLGSWHRKGFVHGYAHGQNWTLAGTLIDNDSAREKDMYDLNNEQELKIYQGYLVYDIIRTFESVVEIFDGLRRAKLEENSMNENTFYTALEECLLEYCKVAFPQFATLREKISGLRALLNQVLPNPHFDPMRDREELETIAISAREPRITNIWARVIGNLTEQHLRD